MKSITAAITTYNRIEEFKLAMQSILRQTYIPEQIIVVDDGNSPEVKDYVESLATKIDLIQHDKNKGLAAARNAAIMICKSQWIAFLDDDDIWENDKLQKQMELIEINSHLDVVYSANATYSDTGELVGVLRPINKGDLKQSIIDHGPLTPSSSFMFRTAVLKKIGGYDEDLISSIDHDIWHAIATNGSSVDFIPEPLVRIREHVNRSTMMTNTQKRVKGVKQFIKKWRPTYREWLGYADGEKRMLSYLIGVLTSLLFNKLLTGKLLQVLWIIKEIIKESKGFRLYAIILVFKNLLIITARKAVPTNIKDVLRNG